MNDIMKWIEKLIGGASWRTTVLGFAVVGTAILGDLGGILTQIKNLLDNDPSTVCDPTKAWLAVTAILYLFKSKAQADAVAQP